MTTKKQNSFKLDAVLKERNATHGDWVKQASCSQELKGNIPATNFNLEPWQREALELILMKISRIIHGDCNHIDSWDDIAGYAQLVANELRKPKTGGKK